MLHEYSRYGHQGTTELDVLSTLTISDNGLVLQGVYEGGQLKARPSNATANSLFAGFSFGIIGTGVPAQVPAAQILKTSAASGGLATAALANPVAAGATLAVFLGDGYGASTQLTPTASATTAPADATHYQLGADGVTITVTAANAAADIFVVYRFAPQGDALRWTYGDQIPGNMSPQNFGRIGAISHGLVYTDMFDTSVDWANVIDGSAGNILRGGANGLVTTTGAGCVVPAKVYHTPSVDVPYLGLVVGEAVGP